MVAAVIAVIAGVRAGICMIAEPTSMVLVWPAIQASMVGASEPYASAAHTTEKPSRSASWARARWSAGVRPRRLVAEAQSELHRTPPAQSELHARLRAIR